MQTGPIPRLAREQLPAHMRDAWQRSVDLRGDAAFVEALGHAPELFDWYADYYQRVFYGGRVEPRLKELLRLRLSGLHGCKSCNLGNRRDAAAAGITPAQLEAIDNADSEHFDAAEKAVLALADQMCLSQSDGRLSPALYQRLRAHFDDAAVIELGITAAVLVGMARFLFVFDLAQREAEIPLPVSRR